MRSGSQHLGKVEVIRYVCLPVSKEAFQVENELTAVVFFALHLKELTCQSNSGAGL